MPRQRRRRRSWQREKAAVSRGRPAPPHRDVKKGARTDALGDLEGCRPSHCDYPTLRRIFEPSRGCRRRFAAGRTVALAGAPLAAVEHRILEHAPPPWNPASTPGPTPILSLAPVVDCHECKETSYPLAGWQFFLSWLSAAARAFQAPGHITGNVTDGFHPSGSRMAGLSARSKTSDRGHWRTAPPLSPAPHLWAREYPRCAVSRDFRSSSA